MLQLIEVDEHGNVLASVAADDIARAAREFEVLVAKKTAEIITENPDMAYIDAQSEAVEELTGDYTRAEIEEATHVAVTDALDALEKAKAESFRNVSVSVHPPSDKFDIPHWTISGDLRYYDDEGNSVYQDAVQAAIVAARADDPSAYQGVILDSEFSCFFAYCPNWESALHVTSLLVRQMESLGRKLNVVWEAN